MEVKVEKRDEEYTVIFSQAHQSFRLDYRGSKKECKWMKEQLETAFKSFEKEVITRITHLERDSQ